MHRTVLLADDSVVVQKIVGLAFAKRDIKLVVVRGGSDVLEKALEVRPDLILAATALPATSGYDLCEAIKRELPRTAFILLAGPAETIDRARALRVGSDDALQKPFDTRNLNNCVDRLLGPYSARPQPAAAGQPGAESFARRPFSEGADPRVERLGPDTATAAAAAHTTTPGPTPPGCGATVSDPPGHLEPPGSQPALHSGLSPEIEDTSPACEVQAPDARLQAVQEDLHKALEAIARDAFGDLCETILTDVVDRVEKIAWEVIPAMTETVLAERVETPTGDDDSTGADTPRKASAADPAKPTLV